MPRDASCKVRRRGEPSLITPQERRRNICCLPSGEMVKICRPKLASVYYARLMVAMCLSDLSVPMVVGRLSAQDLLAKIDILVGDPSTSACYQSIMAMTMGEQSNNERNRVMSEWSIGVNEHGEMFVMRNDEPIVGFTADYTRKLYMALHSYYAECEAKIS